VRTVGLLGLVAAVLAVTALASPWVAWGAAAIVGRPFGFARVYDRVFEVLLVAGVLTSWRRLDLGSAAGLGFRRHAWARELARGLAIGFAGLAVGLSVAALFGGLVPALRFSPGKTVRKALLGAGAGDVLAVAATALLYAAVHVIRARSFGGPGDAWSGVAQTITLFAPLASGAALPQLLGLALLGWLLAVARLRSSALWLPIGIHAAWVATFRVGRLFFGIRPTPAWLVGTGWPPLVGGVAGWIAVGVAAALLARRRLMFR